MGYTATLLKSGQTAKRVRLFRGRSGTWYAFWIDGTATGRIMRSTDGGVTWADWIGTPGGETNFAHPMMDHVDRFWMGTEKNGANFTPRLYFWDSVAPSWSAVHTFSSFTDALNPYFAVDAYNIVAAGGGYPGYPTFYATYRRSVGGVQTVYWSTTDSVADERIDTIGGGAPGNGSSQYTPIPIIAAGGKAYFAWIEAGDAVYIKTRVSGSTLSARDSASTGYTVDSLEDAAINPRTNLPGVIFRTTASKLYLSELGASGDWTIQKVWDGTNDYTHPSTRARLSYDMRGGPHVLCQPVISGDPSAVIYQLPRDIGATAWQPRSIGTNLEDVIAGSLLTDLGWSRGGMLPSVMYQGATALAWVRTDGQPTTNCSLYLVWPDQYPGDGVYPDIATSLTGQLPPRRKEEDDYPSIVLAGDDTGTTSYPFVPDHAYEEEPDLEENLQRVELGSVQGRPKYTAATGLYRLVHNALPRADYNTLKTFLNARYTDLEAFTLQLPDVDTSIKAYPKQGTFEFERIGPDAFRCSNVVVKV